MGGEVTNDLAALALTISRLTQALMQAEVERDAALEKVKDLEGKQNAEAE